MQYYNLTAIVLKREDYKENDVLATVYSEEKGKLRLFVKSAKKITSKLAGHIEPVSLVKLEVVTRRSGNDQIAGAQQVEAFGKIKNNVARWAYAAYYSELVDRLVGEGWADKKIFKILLKALERLERETESGCLSLRSRSDEFQSLCNE